ncbi:hypothetical protein [Nannocystis sp.]|uniref:hypothetical protein n=1 Tax=Nannocystis sp. TaxID=1962667 RepID=UPI0025E76FCC|nr:hypothetical protein [Nannocystis sp.]MBK7826531.1 hypothetical protein [Nannocystis sp.]
MTFLARTLALRGLLLLALVLAGLGIGAGRRAFIRQFFVDGAVADDAPVWPRAPIGAGVEPVVRVRVVLLDGLSRSHAAGLPHLSELCARGQELHVDVGFPTVSLPVQHVLWTGRTQQQSGVQYHVGGLPEPPRAALPRQVDSVAVAESHPEIVHAFGFSRALPQWDASDDPTSDDLPNWRAHDFIPTAHAAVTSPARLAFVHVLRVDEAGHRSGAASLDYATAAAWADSLLGVLHTAAPSDPGTLWLVLSDHGHRAAGGHGGAEPEIRIVRACLFGGAVAPGLPALVHLVDLSRALADALSAELHPEARGRPLAAALQDPARGATIPRPGPLRWTVAGLIIILASLSLRTGRSHHVPWTSRLALLSPPLGGPRWLPPALGVGWLLLALLGVTAECGWPSLSNPAVYPPQGQAMLYASGPGLLGLLVLAGVAVWRWDCSDAALLRAALVPWALITLAALVLCRAPDALLFATPPLMPSSTGLASMLLVQGRAACFLLALLLALRACRQLWLRRRKAPAPAPAPAPRVPA